MNNEIEILLVEDNPDDAELTIRALKKNNIINHIVHLKDGDEALDFLFRNGEYANLSYNNHPKFILLDLKMPKVNGKEVIRQLKANPSTASIPIVVLTSSKEDPDIETCYQLGVNSYIVKPVGFENFTKSVAQLGLYWMLLNQPPIRNK